MAEDARRRKTELADGWCWSFASAADRIYHDTEWGVPVHDDTCMFEHLSIECLQCGLSWNTVLLKRPILRACFSGFDICAVASFGEHDVERILNTPGMLRSKRKIEAIVGNARAALRVREEFGSLCTYFWSWTGGKTVLYEGHEKGGIPAKNRLSELMAKDLKRRGFSFVGPTNVYAHLQACGIVCDHNERCPRYAHIVAAYPCVRMARDGEPNGQ